MAPEETVRFSAGLPSHPHLTRRRLDNGLEYLILQNKKPENRFEAHLEILSGSVDEMDHQQGKVTACIVNSNINLTP